MDAHKALDTVIARAIGEPAGNVHVAERPPLPHQSNRLFDVYAGTLHLIAKQYVRPDELRQAPLREFSALVLLAPYDVAPRPLYYDADVAPIVVYEYLDGDMWDRKRPNREQLDRLADTWLTIHAAKPETPWLSRGYGQRLVEKAVEIQRDLQAYLDWRAHRYSRNAQIEQVFDRITTQAREIATALDAHTPPLCFCRADPRFANVIRRPDGRLGLIDWEDSGMRDPARDIADMMTHPNQEDLLQGDEWDGFLDRYLAARVAQDPAIAKRIHLYLGLFPVWWLSILLLHGMRRAERGSEEQASINDLPVNQRLRRYVSRALSWPDTSAPVTPDNVGDFEFFPGAE